MMAPSARHSAGRKAYLNARLIDPAADREERGGLLVRDGVIQAVGPQVTDAADAQVIDCAGQVLAPGLIDMRAFIGEPGGPYRETLKSAGEAAAAGGVTTVVSMPDTNPVLDDPAVIDFIVRRARDTSIVNSPAGSLIVSPSARYTCGWKPKSGASRFAGDG